MVTTKSPADRLDALAVYVESLVEGRRVAVFGERSNGLGDRLALLGARSVVEVAPGDDIAALRSRGFDVAFVLDPAAFGSPAELLARARRLLADDGVAIVTAGGALDYYQLFDLVAGEFEDIRMVAELPFRGLALVELGGDESPSVSVDTQLADPDRTPETYIAVASRRGARLDPYAIVELPATELEPVRQAESLDISAALAQERLRAGALEAELARLRERLSGAQELEDALAVQVARVAELQAALEEERAEAEEGRAAVARLEEAELRAAQAVRVTTAAESEIARSGLAHELELGRFEEMLRDRAQAIRQLEAELVRRERMIRELVETVAEAKPEPRHALSADPTPLTDELARENGILRWRLDALAMDLARRDAEAQAGEWAIQELEHELAREAANASNDGEPGPSMAETSSDAPAWREAERRMANVLGELDALRLALTQEHAARVDAESGEELARARGEIQRQAALVEQLARELAGVRTPQDREREELR